MNIPNLITVFRLILAPVFAYFAIIYSLSVSHEAPKEWMRWTAITLFTIASLSDAIDGYLARKWNQQNAWGAFMDPLADKTLVLTAMVMLAVFPWGENDWRFPYWYVALVIAREVMIIYGVYYLKKHCGSLRYAPQRMGKWCTFFQMLALGWLMFHVPLPLWIPVLFSSIVTAWTMWSYYQYGLNLLKKTD